MATHNDFGRSAEDHAALLLERNGWTILHRNWRWHHKEIDLIARSGDVVAFVEVKARSSSSHGHPLEFITWRKRRDLEAAARAWVHQHGQARDTYRFDAVWVLARAAGGIVLEHVAEAWRL